MKKVFIVSACALTLCFASCATNEAPAEEAQIETPQIEETSEDETAAEPEADATEEADLAAENENEQTELFPERKAHQLPGVVSGARGSLQGKGDRRKVPELCAVRDSARFERGRERAPG